MAIGQLSYTHVSPIHSQRVYTVHTVEGNHRCTREPHTHTHTHPATPLPEPPMVRERLIQEIHFLADHLRAKTGRLAILCPIP